VGLPKCLVCRAFVLSCWCCGVLVDNVQEKEEEEGEQQENGASVTVV